MNLKFLHKLMLKTLHYTEENIGFAISEMVQNFLQWMMVTKMLTSHHYL